MIFSCCHMLSSFVKTWWPRAKSSQLVRTCPNNAKRQLDWEYSIIYIYMYVSLIYMYVPFYYKDVDGSTCSPLKHIFVIPVWTRFLLRMSVRKYTSSLHWSHGFGGVQIWSSSPGISYYFWWSMYIFFNIYVGINYTCVRWKKSIRTTKQNVHLVPGATWKVDRSLVGLWGSPWCWSLRITARQTFGKRAHMESLKGWTVILTDLFKRNDVNSLRVFAFLHHPVSQKKAQVCDQNLRNLWNRFPIENHHRNLPARKDSWTGWIGWNSALFDAKSGIFHNTQRWLKSYCWWLKSGVHQLRDR